jgi:hypothetical protein
MNILSLTSKQLKHAAKIKDEIAALEKQLAKIAGGNGSGMPSPFVARKRGRMSAAGRARIAAAQKLRWSKVKGKSAKPAKKRKMSAAARAKIAAAAKKRWAKAKAAGKNKL